MDKNIEKTDRYQQVMKETFHEIKVPELSSDFTAAFYSKLESQKKHKAVLPSFNLKFMLPQLSLAGAALAIIAVIIVKSYTGMVHNQNMKVVTRTNSDTFMEIAVSQNNAVEEKNLVESQSRQLLENIL